MNATLTTQLSPDETATPRVWLCWSPRQNGFHIEDEDAGLAINRRAFDHNAKLDYMTIGVFTTREDANQMADKLLPQLRRRERPINPGDAT